MKRQTRRTLIQLLASVFQNGYFQGFMRASIFKGDTKALCVPGLNCYSCPGALGACPIGALQAVLGSRKFNFSFYVLGLILLFGVLLGRLVCGFLCPFGLVQDALFRIKCKKLSIPKRADRMLRYVKYAVLAVLVVLLPIALTDPYGTGAPYFCKLLCPAGTLLAGIPLIAGNAQLAAQIGLLFYWKLAVLCAVLALSCFLYRPFCKFLCPLGALYGLLNGAGAYRLRVDEARCTHCGACAHACPMQVPLPEKPNHPECIRCGRCKDACPTKAIAGSILGFPRK